MKLSLKSKKGIILIVTYLVITVLLTFSLIFLNRSISENRIATRFTNLTLAFNIAESGLDSGLNWLRSQGSPPEGTAAIVNPLGAAEQRVIGINGTYSYTLIIDPDDNNPGSYLKRYKIIVTSTAGDINQTLTREVQTDSYSRYAYFTDIEHFSYYGLKIPVWFTGGDSIQGPTQTNGHFHMKNNPLFAGQTKSEDNFITFYNNGAYFDSTAISNPPLDIPDFQQGIDLGTEPINMPSKALDLRTAAVQNGIHLSGPATIVLNSNGTITVTNANKGWVNQNMALPVNKAIFVTGGDLTVSGTLKGQLTMGTNRDVVITDNILYSDNPRSNPASTDMLGLIAEKDIVIAQTAPNNIEVDASVMALGNSFLVENWWVGPAKGTISVYGGIIQRERGPVGTFSSITGTKLSGYTKDYDYDARLIASPPPFYPTTGDYVSLSWR